MKKQLAYGWDFGCGGRGYWTAGEICWDPWLLVDKKDDDDSFRDDTHTHTPRVDFYLESNDTKYSLILNFGGWGRSLLFC